MKEEGALIKYRGGRGRGERARGYEMVDVKVRR